jgi:hypothetical protein
MEEEPFMMRLFRAPGSAEHRKVQELLSSYLDGEVSPDERILTERHLSHCPECARSLRNLEATVRLLKDLPPVSAPRSFVLSQVPSPDSRSRIFSWGYPLLRGATALAALLLLVVVSADFALQTVVSPRSQPSSMPVAKELAPAPGREALSPSVEPDLGLTTSSHEPDIRVEEEFVPEHPPAEEVALEEAAPEEAPLPAEAPPPEEEGEMEIAARPLRVEPGQEAETPPEVDAELPPSEEPMKAEIPAEVAEESMDVPSVSDEAVEAPEDGQEVAEEAGVRAGEPAVSPTISVYYDSTEVEDVLAVEKEPSELPAAQPVEALPSPISSEAPACGLSRILRWAEFGLLSLCVILLAAMLLVRRKRVDRPT